MCCRVEGAALHALAVASHESLGPRQHFLRRSPRERQQQNALGRYTALEEVGYPVDERSRLACACSRDDEKSAIAVRCGGGLLRIQLCCEVARSPRRLGAQPRRVDLERFGHATGSGSVEREGTTAA